jgi:hypothetical protein
MNQTKVLQKDATYHTLDFTICTIVNDMAEYEIMKKTFVDNGFTDKCEYIIADNCNGNQFDAYQAISHFLKIAKGEYLIIVHQDVRVLDNKETLNNCLRTLDEKDEKWAICGNAGGEDYKKLFYSIDNNGDVRKSDNLPQQVFSLDENLLIIDTKKQLSISADIKGFHFYGTDLCIIADFLGYTSYVIPFMVQHLSSGNLADMELYKPSFIKLYGHKLRARFIQTTCTKFYLSNSTFKNKFYNSSIFFALLKPYRRLFKK